MRYPRVKIDDAGHDSQSSDVLAGFFAALATDDTTTQGGNSLGTLGSAGLAKGLHAAMIPDEYELGQYNIPVDSDTVGGQPGQAGFSPYFADNDRASYSIWAPYTGVGSKPNGYTDAMNGEIDKITQLANLGTGVMADGKTQLKSDLVTGMGSVNSTLLKRNGFNVFQMPDPLSTAFYQNNTPPIIPGKVTTKWGTTPATAGQFIATSWTTDHDANYFNNGRDGYSVKMIPLRLLLSQPGKLTNDPSGQANWVPVSGGFGGERPDMQKTAH